MAVKRPARYRIAGDAVAGAHYGYLAYLVGGGFLAWRWPRSIVLHALAAAWAVVVVAARLPCPLTATQNILRERGGEPRLTAGFMDTYISGTFYPTGREADAHRVAAAIVAVSWLGFARRSRARRRRSVSAAA